MMQRFGEMVHHAPDLYRMSHGQFPPHPLFSGHLPNLAPQYPHPFPTMSVAQRLAGKYYTSFLMKEMFSIFQL